MIKNDNTRFSVTVSKNVHAKLLKEAEFEGRSLSNLVSKIINEHYKIKTDD